MSDSNCAIVCNVVDALVCGCNSDGGRSCSGYCSCTGNRSSRKTSPTYSNYTPYCYVVNSYKYKNTPNNNNIKCSLYTIDSNSTFKCVGVRDKANIDSTYKQYNRSTGGEVYNSLISSQSDERYKSTDYTTDSKVITNTITDVKTNDLNEILKCLRSEIKQRNNHYWYSGIKRNNPDDDTKTVYVPGFYFAIYKDASKTTRYQPINEPIINNNIGIVTCADLLTPPYSNDYRNASFYNRTSYPYCDEYYTTYAYSTQMWMDQNITYKFTFGNDEYATLKIDNELYSTPSCKNYTIDYVCSTSGWHQIEMRIHNNSGAYAARFVWSKTGDETGKVRYFDCKTEPDTFRIPHDITGVTEEEINRGYKEIEVDGFTIAKFTSNVSTGLVTTEITPQNIIGYVENPYMLYTTTNETYVTYVFKSNMRVIKGNKYYLFCGYNDNIKVVIDGNEHMPNTNEYYTYEYDATKSGFIPIEIRIYNNTGNGEPLFYNTSKYAVMWSTDNNNWYPFMVSKDGTEFKTTYRIDLTYLKNTTKNVDNDTNEELVYNQEDVTNNDIIETIQKNTPIDILTKIRTIIEQRNDFSNNMILTPVSRKSNVGDMIRSENLKSIEQDLLNINIDCICYSDCTNFLVRKRRSCSCNIDCVCNYR